MKVKLFTLPFSDEQNGFDSTALDEFVARNKITTVTEHFFSHQDRPYWALMLTYDEEAQARAEPETYVLSETQQQLWDMLKAWRLGRSKQDKHPAYFILHDRQLLDIVRAVPTTITALMKIRGIGDNKSQRYGTDILGVIAEWQKNNPSPTK